MTGFNTRKETPEPPRADNRSQGKTTTRKPGAFKSVATGKFLTTESALKTIPFILFLAGLGMIYIANNFYTERTIRATNRMKKELKELRFEYIASKSQYSDSTKQSKVARKLAEMGIKEAVAPPEKIFVKESELQYPR